VWFVLQNDKRFTLSVDLLLDITAHALGKTRRSSGRSSGEAEEEASKRKKSSARVI
jgi:hypothetical protein